MKTCLCKMNISDGSYSTENFYYLDDWDCSIEEFFSLSSNVLIYYEMAETFVYRGIPKRNMTVNVLARV